MDNDHEHRFRAEDWKFDCTPNTATYCSGKVLDPEHFIDEVYHDHDGDWQFFHQGGDSNSEPRIFCLGCLCDFDPTILSLHDLPAGWFAYRDRKEDGWVRKDYERQEEADGD